jgi:hypothetical protein
MKMEKDTVGIAVGTILQVLAQTLFLLGSFVCYGTIILGFDPTSGAYFGTTYVSYWGFVQGTILTLIGAMLMSSVLILRSECGKYTGHLFLGLLLVNSLRLIFRPPNWSSASSGFSSDMLFLFELGSMIALMLLILAQIFYARFVMSEDKSKGALWFLSLLTILAWMSVLAFSALWPSMLFVQFLIHFPRFGVIGLGMSNVLIQQDFLLFVPLEISVFLILANSVSKVRNKKNKELRQPVETEEA